MEVAPLKPDQEALVRSWMDRDRKTNVSSPVSRARPPPPPPPLRVAQEAAMPVGVLAILALTAFVAVGGYLVYRYVGKDIAPAKSLPMPVRA